MHLILLKVIQSQRNETDLELGTVGSETSKVVHFALVNENPVSVNLHAWDTSLHSAVVSLVAIQSGNVSTFFTKSYFNDSISEVLCTTCVCVYTLVLFVTVIVVRVTH